MRSHARLGNTSCIFFKLSNGGAHNPSGTLEWIGGPRRKSKASIASCLQLEGSSSGRVSVPSTEVFRGDPCPLPYQLRTQKKFVLDFISVIVA